MEIWAQTIRAGLLAVGLLQADVALATGLSGPYLAGRQASFLGDYGSAAHYYGRALAFDTDRPELLERAVLSNVSLGDVATAAALAERMNDLGFNSELAQMALVARYALDDDYAALVEAIEGKRGMGPLGDGLVKGWALVGQGDLNGARTSFDAVGKIQGLASFAAYHKALALASVGEFEAADELFSTGAAGGMANTRRGVLARVEILSELGRADEAENLLADSFAAYPDPALDALRAALSGGKDVKFQQVVTARDGIAEVFYSLAGALSAEGNDDLTLLYSRVTEYLRPDHIDAILLSAELLDTLGQHELAIETYDKVPTDSAFYHIAAMGRAEALRTQDRLEEAADVLKGLSQSHATLPLVHATYGDLLRQMEDFDAAAEAYGHALTLYDAESEQQWFIYYARAITYERQDQWEAAEADFRKALALNPDQPQVLNYLGYSLVQKKIKLDEALDMIERAIAARPNSGYIIDSLGWALFKLGRYDEAVPHMERAAELMSIDPVVNDHLGDVYWAVGREREAEFMWKRALSFVDWEDASEEVDGDRIRRKLEIGLDRVLADEGAAPLLPSND